MFTTYRRSPHAAHVANWAVEIGSETCVARELLQNTTKRLKQGAEPSTNARNSLITLQKARWKIKRLKRKLAAKDWIFENNATIDKQEKKVQRNMAREVELSYSETVITEQTLLPKQKKTTQPEDVRLIAKLQAKGKNINVTAKND